MAKKPFDRIIINPRERPLSSDVNDLEAQLDYALRTVLLCGTKQRLGLSSGTEAVVPQGFLGDAFKPDFVSGMTVSLRAGLGAMNGTGDTPSAIGGVLGLDDLSPLKPLYLPVPVTLTIPAADATNKRIDLIEVKYKRAVGNPLSRDVLDPTSGAFVATLVNKNLGFELGAGDVTINGSGAINIKTGTPAATPLVPATDAGYVAVGHVYVPATATNLAFGHVNDARAMLSMTAPRVAVSGGVDMTTGVLSADPLIVAPPGWDVVVHTKLSGGVVYVGVTVRCPAACSGYAQGLGLQTRPIVSGYASTFLAGAVTLAEQVFFPLKTGVGVGNGNNTILAAATSKFPAVVPTFGSNVPGANAYFQSGVSASAPPLIWDDTAKTFNQTALAGLVVDFSISVDFAQAAF